MTHPRSGTDPNGSMDARMFSSGSDWYVAKCDRTVMPGIAPSCSLRYATAFACCGLRTSREPNEASATMWSSSLAGSMPSRTAAIGRGVGAGVGKAVAVGIALSVAADDTGADGGVDAGPQDASTIASATRCGRTIPVYRGRDEISASAWEWPSD